MIFILLLFLVSQVCAQSWNCSGDGLTWTNTNANCTTNCTIQCENIKYGECKTVNGACIAYRVGTCEGSQLECTSQSQHCEAIDCKDKAKDFGTTGMIGGVIAAVSLLTLTCVIVSLAYCRHEKRYCFAYLLTQAEKNRRMREERDEMLNVNYDTEFKQQRLSAWTPKITLYWTTVTYLVIAIWCLPLGSIIWYASSNSVAQEYRYDNVENCDYNNDLNTKNMTGEPFVTCEVSFQIEHDMPAPVYMYYKLTGFYQNHRNYVKSRDEKELRAIDDEGHADCDPLIRYGDWGEKVFNSSLVDRVLYPCGLVAQSYFNDEFSNPCVSTTGNSTCNLLTGRNWQKEGIAWGSDLKKKFIPRALRPSETRESPRGFTMPDMDDEDFVVWMRSSTAPDLTKLHRQILDRGLDKGEVFNVTVKNRFPVWKWKGQKSIVLATVSFMGGGNPGGRALAIAHLVTGAMAVVTGLYIWVRYQQVDGSRYGLPVRDPSRKDAAVELQNLRDI